MGPKVDESVENIIAADRDQPQGPSIFVFRSDALALIARVRELEETKRLDDLLIADLRERLVAEQEEVDARGRQLQRARGK